MKDFLKAIPALLLFPIADPKAFGFLLLAVFAMFVVMAIPLILTGLLIGLGIQFSGYLVNLWGQINPDTKILTIVGIVTILVSSVLALPTINNIIKNIREFAWNQLEKNKLHYRGGRLFSAPETHKPLK